MEGEEKSGEEEGREERVGGGEEERVGGGEEERVGGGEGGR